MKQKEAEKAPSGLLGPDTSGKTLENSTRKTVFRNVISLCVFFFLNCVVFETEYILLLYCKLRGVCCFRVSSLCQI